MSTRTRAAAPPSPREWIGTEPFPWPAIADVEEGARIVACYAVESKQLGMTRGEKPYLRLQLSDRSGTIEGRVWDDAETIDAMIEEGDFVGVRGSLQSFRGQRQLKIDELRPIAVEPNEYEFFLPRFAGDLAALEARLDALVASVEDGALRALLERLVGAESELGRAFRRAPAAKRNHHAYVGGLLEHSVSVAENCGRLAEHYGEEIDRDLLVTGALIHDIGKIREIGVRGGFPYTDEGKLLGHILLGLRIVEDEARHVAGLAPERLLLLLHLVASHQGRYEWQSPKIPMLLEAIILHYADDLDAKMQQAMTLVASVESGWTRYDPSFGRDFFRHRGVRETEHRADAFDTAEEAPESADASSAARTASRDDAPPAPVERAEAGDEKASEELAAAGEREAAGQPPAREMQPQPKRQPAPEKRQTDRSTGFRLSEDTIDLFAG